MIRNSGFAIVAGSIYLLVYLICLFFNLIPEVVMVMFMLSPLLILWMAYTIIRYGKYSGRELAEGEEWAYEDKEKDKLGLL